MKKTIILLSLMVSALMVSCGYDDDRLWDKVNENTQRIEQLEEWQANINSNISSLQGLVNALEGKDFVTGIVPFTSPTPGGYKITFSKSGEATIWNGAKGETGATGPAGPAGPTGATGAAGHSPVVGVKEFPESSGVYYWTLDGEWMPDEANKMRVTGDDGADAVAPQVKIDTDGTSTTYNEWLISTDGGTTWTSTGVKATGEKGDQGDAIFAADGIDVQDDHVIFTLADGTTTITVPLAKTVTVGFESYETLTVSPDDNKVAIVLPATLKADDYTAILAELKHENGETYRDIATRAASVLQIVQPTFAADGTYEDNAAVVINPPATSNGELAILKVTFIDKKGQETSVSRAVSLYGNALFAAFATGGNITLDQDYILDQDMPLLTIPAGVTVNLNLNGHKLQTSKLDQIAIVVHGELTIDGPGEVKAENSYAIWAIGDSKVTINSGNFYGHYVCIQTNDNAAVEINGGYFKTPIPLYGSNWVLNLQDKKPNTITVKGGQFEGCDPSATGTEPAGWNDNFLADGYTSKKISDSPVVYEVSKLNDIAEAMTYGGKFTLQADYKIGAGEPPLTVPAGATLILDLNGHEIKSSEVGQDALEVHGNLIINGDGNITAENSYAIWARNDAKIVINGGTFYGHFVCIQTRENASIEINGGYFKTPEAYNGKHWVLNLQDNDPNTIIVKGGQFEGCDPSATGLEPAGLDNLVAAGYKSTKISETPVIYEVTEE